ncbi:TPA: hypothetical protein P0N70_003034 [Yersinia enterocolitica]|nr:hypothetical protein [Yersinia enterocolitica]HDM8294982.1 hypothetical protein [Yersinia enterocolitica]HDM8319977.1 hypothetical protein [Yersinia enterocolitica]HDM8332963.1 hypothetical protein [Yersinia enterocolitica]
MLGINNRKLSFMNKSDECFLMGLLITLLLIISPLSFAENRPGFVCGKFIETKFSISDKYLLKPPEYMSDKKQKDNDNCNDEFQSLALFATWPEMSPTRYQSYAKAEIEYANGYKEIIISLMPTTQTDTDLASQLYFYYDKSANKIAGKLKVDDVLGLFYIDRVEIFKTGDVIMSRNYWTLDYFKIPIFIKCHYILRMKDYSECRLVFIFPEMQASVNVFFFKDKLPQWKEISTSTKTFLLSHIKR